MHAKARADIRNRKRNNAARAAETEARGIDVEIRPPLLLIRLLKTRLKFIQIVYSFGNVVLHFVDARYFSWVFAQHLAGNSVTSYIESRFWCFLIHGYLCLSL